MIPNGWDKWHAMYSFGGQYYSVTEYASDDYCAEVLGQWADGRTPAEAIQNAARRHQKSSEESEE